MESATIKIGGMSCMGCARSVSDVLQATPGVSRAEVSLERGEVQIDFDATKLSTGDLRAAIEKAGFEAA